MPHIDIEILSPFTARYLEGRSLTPAERAEVLRLAQGFACKDSAAAASVSPETIRARRKRIYRKLDVAGSGELISELLAVSLKMLARGAKLEPRVRRPLAGGEIVEVSNKLPAQGALLMSPGANFFVSQQQGGTPRAATTPGRRSTMISTVAPMPGFISLGV